MRRFIGFAIITIAAVWALSSIPAAAVDSRTWDRTEITLAAIADVVTNIKVKAEYNIHGESTGGADVDNNELLVQLEAKF